MSVAQQKPAPDAGPPPPGWAERHFTPAVAALVLIALATQVAILTEAAAQNPFARVLDVDAKVYWEWARRVARGDLLLEEPFFSAPLYPYLLGALRALGGGLAAAHVAQAALHLGTIALLAYVGRRRHGAAVGLGAAALYAVLLEPAFQTGRVLNGSLQLFITVALWDRLLRLERGAKRRELLLGGVALGACCLVHPPMMVTIPFVAVWAFGLAGRGAAGTRSALLIAGTAAAGIAPATVHNFAATGELIPISAAVRSDRQT